MHEFPTVDPEQPLQSARVMPEHWPSRAGGLELAEGRGWAVALPVRAGQGWFQPVRIEVLRRRPGESPGAMSVRADGPEASPAHVDDRAPVWRPGRMVAHHPDPLVRQTPEPAAICVRDVEVNRFATDPAPRVRESELGAVGRPSRLPALKAQRVGV